MRQETKPHPQMQGSQGADCFPDLRQLGRPDLNSACLNSVLVVYFFLAIIELEIYWGQPPSFKRLKSHTLERIISHLVTEQRKMAEV